MPPKLKQLTTSFALNDELKLQTRCPQCGYCHSGLEGTVCDVCYTPQYPQSPAPALEEPPPVVTFTPVEKDTFPEVNDEAPQTPAPPLEEAHAASVPVPVPVPIMGKPSPRRCAYEPCSQPLMPRQKKNRYHSVQCAALARIAAHPEQQRQASRQRRSVQAIQTANYTALIRAELTKLESLCRALEDNITEQQRHLAVRLAQAECLREWLRLETMSADA